MRDFTIFIVVLFSYLTGYSQGRDRAFAVHKLFVQKRHGSETTAATLKFYVGIEGILYANQLTKLSPGAPNLAAQGKELIQGREVLPGGALTGGYRFSPRFSLEAGVQDLPVLTGYTYEWEDGSSYLGFGQSYTHDYLYVPVRGVVQVLGLGGRLGLSVMAGGGPAWTGSDANAVISPYGTEVHYTDGNGGVGVGPAAPSGTTTLATATLGLAHEATTIAVFEAGLRGSWRVRPHLHLDLTVRQLWSPVRSARDIRLDLQTPTAHVATTLTTPVQSLASGLSVRYLF
ncbi:hypothetical protein [Hymenobacter baengnokdamensis]|uniref:hypothetical protein n=1 Tax=Hymenobacter baengnokdamensis TaxID=2615203 RepID=UPI001246D057|nr:hypothetical protein [Hymenobacter baengnokdamensis]